MSNTQFAFLKKDDIPKVEDWQAAINELNFDQHLELDRDLEPFTSSGFVPCKWGETNDEVGFEIYYESISEMLDNYEFPEELIQDKDYCISLVWGSSMNDCVAVMIASSALANKFNAIISYDGEPSESLEKIIKDTRDIIKDVLNNDNGLINNKIKKNWWEFWK